jgi:formylmethanofuran dehydrogenase subunit E
MNSKNKDIVMEIKPFSDVTLFHGHVCPGSALGYQAAKAGLKELSGERSQDEEIIAIVENDSCAVDAIQVVTGCTFGKGNLIFFDFGKQAYTFASRDTGEAVRVSMKSSFDMNKLEPKLAEIRQKVSKGGANQDEKEELGKLMGKVSKKVLELPPEDIFDVNKVEIKIPPKASMHPSLECSVCGEIVSEHRVRVKNGLNVCIPCFEK